MSRHADTYIQARAPQVKGAGVDKQAHTWLKQGTSCGLDCHTGEVAWLTANTGTSGYGFHVGVEELKEVRARFERTGLESSSSIQATNDDYDQDADVDHDWLDKATRSDDGDSRWDHLK
jgi:hypothetical protein